MSQNNQVGNNSPYANCTSVTPQCPVDQTIYTYRPNLAANVFFLVMFGLAMIVQVILGIKWKTWTFMIALVLGCLGEMIGYIGRIMLNSNPWDMNGFIIQITCLIIAPAFTSAGIYLTLKHFVLLFGEKHSVLKPSLYTWIFIGGDLFSIALQGAGGGLESSANTPSMLNTGAQLSLAGIGFQVGMLGIFGILFALYFLRVWLNRSQLSSKAQQNAQSKRFRLFFAAIILAYTTILIRCIYRIPELAGGWRNEVMLNEIDFMVLDNTMVLIATLALTIVHPGFCFDGLSKAKKGGVDAVGKELSSDSDGSGLERGEMMQS